MVLLTVAVTCKFVPVSTVEELFWRVFTHSLIFTSIKPLQVMYKYVYPQAPSDDKAVHLNQNCMQFLTKCTKFLPDYI
jgi:hypothetical protein